MIRGLTVNPTTKVIWKRDISLIVSSDRLKDPGIKPAVPGLKGRTYAVNTN